LAASCDPGYNLPDGCTDAAIDRRFGEGKPTCAECVKMHECCCDYGICEIEFDDAFWDRFDGTEPHPSDVAHWALPWVANHMRDMQEAACETFVSY
jgi:hypothetical protein